MFWADAWLAAKRAGLPNVGLAALRRHTARREKRGIKNPGFLEFFIPLFAMGERKVQILLLYLLFLSTDKEKEFFQEIYQQYKDEMFGIAQGILKNNEDAEDVVQETFLTLIDNLDKIMDEEPHKVRNYIITITKHKSYNLFNRRRMRAEREEEEWLQRPVFEKSPEILAEEAELEQVMVELLRRMKEPYREVLKLQYYHEMSVAEIAELLDKTPDNIRHVSMRAKKKLLSIVKEAGIECD